VETAAGGEAVNAVPQSFSDFGEESLRPDYVVKSSYGNDYPPNTYMFRPSDSKGNPEGIRAKVAWAHTVKTKEPARSGCDGGFCVS
jgi:hypothetical protein